MAGPFLTTERFELWQPQKGDLAGLVELVADAETQRFLGPARADEPSQFERLLRNAGGWTLYGYGVFVVREPGRQAIIGSCGVFHSWRGKPGLDDVPEAGWIVHKDRWGKGVAGEVMRAALAWFDETHGVQRIACMIEEGNTASERLAASLGFAEYEREPVEGEERALVLYHRI